MLLSAAFSQHYAPRNLRNASDSTFRLWAIAFGNYGKFLGREPTTDDLTDAQLIGFAIARRGTVSPATINRDLASLLALWRYLHRRGLVATYPDVPLEREPVRVPTAWTREQFDALLAATAKARGWVGPVLASQWFTALVVTGFDTGERIGALLGLTWDDVNLTDGWLVFRAEHRKGRAADNAVKISADTAKLLSAMPRKSPQVFPWPYRLTHLWKRYGRILEKAGLPNTREHKFHCIRRTTASHVEAAGGDATSVLRHASRRNTLSYIDPRIAQPPQAVDVLWRPTTPRPPGNVA